MPFYGGPNGRDHEGGPWRWEQPAVKASWKRQYRVGPLRPDPSQFGNFLGMFHKANSEAEKTPLFEHVTFRNEQGGLAEVPEAQLAKRRG